MSDENPFAGAPRWNRKNSRDKSFSQNSHLWGNVPKNIVHVTPTPHMMKIGNETNGNADYGEAVHGNTAYGNNEFFAKSGDGRGQTVGSASNGNNAVHGNTAHGVSSSGSANKQSVTNADSNKKPAKPAWKKFVIPAIIVSATVIAIAIVAIIIFVIKSHNKSPTSGQKPPAKSPGFVAAVPPVQQHPLSGSHPQNPATAQPPSTAQPPQQFGNNSPQVPPSQNTGTNQPHPSQDAQDRIDVSNPATDGLSIDEMISQLQAQKRLSKTVSLTPQMQDHLYPPRVPLVTSTSTQNTRQMMEQLAAQQQQTHDTMRHSTDTQTLTSRDDSDGPPLPLPAVRVSYEDLRKGTTTSDLAPGTDPTISKRSVASTNITKQGQENRNDTTNSHRSRVNHSPSTVDLEDRNNARVAAAYLKAIADQLDVENHGQSVQVDRTEEDKTFPVDTEASEVTTEDIGTVEDEDDQVVEEEEQTRQV